MSDDDVQGIPDNNDKNPHKEEQAGDADNVLDPLEDPSLLDDDNSESIFNRDGEDDGYCDEDYSDDDMLRKLEETTEQLLQSIEKGQKKTK